MKSTKGVDMRSLGTMSMPGGMNASISYGYFVKARVEVSGEDVEKITLILNINIDGRRLGSKEVNGPPYECEIELPDEEPWNRIEISGDVFSKDGNKIGPIQTITINNKGQAGYGVTGLGTM